MKRLTIALVLVAGLLPAPRALAQLDTRTSAAAGVTVKVTPKLVAADVPAWEFAVVLDSHVQDLTDDLLKTTVLLDGAGSPQSPSVWEGAAPGGHHREGVLRFATPRPVPAAVELRLQRAGEASPRVFRWNLK
jgi:hypothetical protein